MILIVWILAAGLLVATVALGLLAGGVMLLEGLRRDRTAAERIFRVLLATLALVFAWAAITRDFPLVISVAVLLAAACVSMLVVGACLHIRESFFD